MGRVFYGLRRAEELYNFFEDNNKFSETTPYIIRVKRFAADDIAPLHCAGNIEIMYLKDAQGEVTINNKSFSLGGEQVFVIPPNVIHSTTIFQGDGIQIIIQISLHDIKKYIDLSAIAEFCGLKLADISYSIPETKGLYDIFTQLIENDNDFSRCISNIALLFSILFKYKREEARPDTLNYEKDENNNEILRRVLNWTTENYSHEIDIGMVSDLTGYSRHYFCNWFKSMTGITYMNHLANVRNTYVCLLLQSGHSVTESCYMCGFGNLSHFIQQFKKKYGVTPKQYADAFGAKKQAQGETTGSNNYDDN